MFCFFLKFIYFQNSGSMSVHILIINLSDRKLPPFDIPLDRVTALWQQQDKSDPSICRCSRWFSVNGGVRNWVPGIAPAVLSLCSHKSVLTTAGSSHHAVHEESNHRRCPKYSESWAALGVWSNSYYFLLLHHNEVIMTLKDILRKSIGRTCDAHKCKPKIDTNSLR